MIAMQVRRVRLYCISSGDEGFGTALRVCAWYGTNSVLQESKMGVMRRQDAGAHDHHDVRVTYYTRTLGIWIVMGACTAQGCEVEVDGGERRGTLPKRPIPSNNIRKTCFSFCILLQSATPFAPLLHVSGGLDTPTKGRKR